MHVSVFQCLSTLAYQGVSPTTSGHVVHPMQGLLLMPQEALSQSLAEQVPKSIEERPKGGVRQAAANACGGNALVRLAQAGSAMPDQAAERCRVALRAVGEHQERARREDGVPGGRDQRAQGARQERARVGAAERLCAQPGARQPGHAQARGARAHRLPGHEPAEGAHAHGHPGAPQAPV